MLKAKQERELVLKTSLTKFEASCSRKKVLAADIPEREEKQKNAPMASPSGRNRGDGCLPARGKKGTDSKARRKPRFPFREEARKQLAALNVQKAAAARALEDARLAKEELARTLAEKKAAAEGARKAAFRQRTGRFRRAGGENRRPARREEHFLRCERWGRYPPPYKPHCRRILRALCRGSMRRRTARPC